VDFFIYVIDVAAGDKIPRKNGPGITQSDILVINKMDLAPYVGADLGVMDHDSRLMRGEKPFLFTNCKTGEGIPELVERMNELVGDGSVDYDAVHEAASRYDERIARGPRFHNDEQLRRIEFARRWPGDRMRTCRFQKILDPKAGPLVAIREFIISRKSMGGLQTDLESRVLDLRGNPVPGLFAAGESAGFGGGGMNGKRSLEGTFLGGCIFGGRIAGRVA